MWPLEYDQRLPRLIKGAPLWIGACHMPSQSSIRATLSVQQKREVVRQECTILLSNQGSKAIFPHECMQHSNIIFTKGFWDIHIYNLSFGNEAKRNNYVSGWYANKSSR